MQFTEYIQLLKAQLVSRQCQTLIVDLNKNVSVLKRKDYGYLIIFGQHYSPTRRSTMKFFAKLMRSSAEIHAFLMSFSFAQSNLLGPTHPQHQLLETKITNILSGRTVAQEMTFLTCVILYNVM